MKNTTRVIALLLCLCMVLPYVPVHAHAAGGAPNVTIILPKTEVQEGDVIDVYLGINATNASSIAFGFDFDNTLLKVTAISAKANALLSYSGVDDFGDPYEGNKEATSLSSREEANASGHIGCVWANDTEVAYTAKTQVVRIRFTALKSGTIVFTMFEDSAGTDGYKGTWTYPNAAPDEPSCNHTSTKLVPNTDGKTHSVVCTNEACNGYVVRTENCSGNDDGDHTNAVKCACGNTVTAATEHTYTQNLRGTLKTAGDCNTKAVYAVKCDNCDYESETLTVEGEYGDHTYGNLIPAQEAVHTKDELKDAVAAHYLCECGKYFDENKRETTLEALTGETSEHTVDPEQTTTETIENPTCTEEGTESVSTFCSCGYAFTVYTQPIPAVGTAHEWNTPTYSWSADGKTCTATRTCKHNAAHKEEETVTGTASVKTPATCQTKGWTTYTVNFVADWAQDGQTNDVQDIPVNANNHVGTATVSYRNNNNGTHTAVSTYECGHTVDGDTVPCSDGNDADELCDSCGNNLHVCAPADYEDNGDGTHTLKCACGEIIKATEDHTYDATTHKCVCGKVEEFTLTIYYLHFYDGDKSAAWRVHKVSVPYGAKLADYIPENDIYQVGDKITVDGDKYQGTYTITDWTYDGSADFVDLTAATMPAENCAIYQDDTFTGWYHEYWDCAADEWSDTRIGTEYWVNNYAQKGWQQIDGSWYYFAYIEAQASYFRAEGLTRVPYPTDKINGNTYAPNQEAMDYAASKGETFIDATEAWFGFNAEGKFQSDFTGLTAHPVIEGAWSYAVNGMLTWHPGAVEDMYFIGDMVNGGNIPANGDTSIVYANGTDLVEGGIYHFTNGVLSGYNGIVDGKYYENSRLMIGNGLTKLGDKYIYVRSNGQIVVNAQYYVPVNNHGIVAGTYTFDADGYLVAPQTTDKNGVVDGYYYENGKIAYNKGLIKLDDGKVIYVKSNGQLATGDYYVTNVANYTGTDVKAGDKVTFDSNGYMVAAKNGIIGGKYYINNQIAYNAGIVEIEAGKYIYVRSNGEVVVGREYWVTNVGDSGILATKYTFDENGILQDPITAGQQIVDGKYFVDGRVVCGAGLVEYNGGYIYVRSNGMVATGKYWITNTNGLMETGYYIFGEDGMMIIM